MVLRRALVVITLGWAISGFTSQTERNIETDFLQLRGSYNKSSEIWTRAVNNAVKIATTRFKTDKTYALRVLSLIAEAEELRPTGDKQPVPDEKRLNVLKTHLDGVAPHIIKGVPCCPMHTRALVSRSETLPKNPIAIKKMVELALTDRYTISCVYNMLSKRPYPQKAPLYTAIVLHPQDNLGDGESLARQIASGEVTFDLVEATAFLYLLRIDHFSDGYKADLLKNWSRWTTKAALARCLPYMTCYDSEEIGEAVINIIKTLSLMNNPPNSWSFPERARIYNALYVRPEKGEHFPSLFSENQPKSRLHKKVDEIVKTNYAITSGRQALFKYPINEYTFNLNLLTFHNTKSNRKRVENEVYHAESWERRGYALYLLSLFSKDRYPLIQDAVLKQLAPTNAERAKQLAIAIFDAETKEVVEIITALSKPDINPTLCDHLESVALKQKNGGAFTTLRNSVLAYKRINPKRAAVFYKSLLNSDESGIRKAGIYACGELKASESCINIAKAYTPLQENSSNPCAVSVALAKIGTPAAYAALEPLLLSENLHAKDCHNILYIMYRIVSPEKYSFYYQTWRNGCQYKQARDKQLWAKRFADITDKLVKQTADDEIRKEATNKLAYFNRRAKGGKQ